MTRSTNARLAGSAYLSYIVVGILNEVLMYRAAGVNGIAAKLARIADYSTDVRFAVIGYSLRSATLGSTAAALRAGK